MRISGLHISVFISGCGSVYISAAGGCVFLFDVGGDENRTGRRVQGTALCLRGIPAGVMCLKSITPIAKIRMCMCKRGSVCFP